MISMIMLIVEGSLSSVSGDYETTNETLIKLMTNTTVLANLTVGYMHVAYVAYGAHCQKSWNTLARVTAWWLAL